MAGVNVSINVPKKVSMTAKVKDTSGSIERYGSKSSSQANTTTTSSQTETIDLDDVVNPSSNANQEDFQTSVDPTTIQENQQNDVSVEEVKAASQEQEPMDTTVQQNTTTQNTNQAETQTTANSQGNINSNTKVEMNANTNSNGTTSASTGNLGTSQASSMNQTGTSSKSQGNISMGGSTNTNGNATSIEMDGIETSNTSGEKSMQVGIDVSTETTQTEGVSSQVELDAEEYKIQLSKVGLREEDIERVVSGEITIEELMQEIENDEQDRSRYEEILIASYLQSAGLDCTTLEEVSQKIDENQQKLEALQEEKRSLENGSNEEEAWQRILGRLQSGESLENVLESEIVAYQYQDEDGNTKYVYDDPYASGIPLEYEYTPLTYEEMYGDEKIKELEQVLTEVDPLFGDTFHSWDGSDSQYEYLDNYFKSLENKNTDEQIKQLEEEIDALINQNAQYKAYQNGIQEEVDYYMNYIDPYTRKEDLGQYSFEQEGIEEDLTKILDMTNYEIDETGDLSYQGITWDGSSNTITITSEETLMKVLCAMINDSSQLTNNETSLMNKDGTIFIQATDKMLDNYEEWAPLMTDEEKSIFNYIYQKEGYEAAYKYLSDITNEMDNRWLSNQTQKDQEFASEHPVLSSIASVFVTPIEGISAACASLNALITNQQILRTDVYSAGDTWRAKISQDLIENYDNGELWSFIYNTGMSMSDSVSLIGISALTGGVATPALSAVLMGSRSYVSTINDALDRGLSDGQAVALAFSSAVVESAMESYSVSHLLNLESKLGQNTVKLVGKIANSIEDDTLANVASKLVYVGASTLSQAFVEGEEEFATEVLNYLFDEVISGDLSNRSQQINQALENGYTIEEAEKMANISFLDQLQQAFIGGFVSGVCFGVFGGVKITHNVSTSIATQIMDEYQVSRSEVSDMLSNLGVSEAQAFASQIEARQQIEMEEENQAKQEQREKMQGFLNYLFDKTASIQTEIQESIVELGELFNQSTSLKMLDLKKSLLGVASSFPAIVNKFRSEQLSSNASLMNKIVNEGLVHITTSELAPKILESSFVKASKNIVTSYGSSKAFFFSGIPSFGDVCLDLNQFMEKAVAVRIKPSISELQNDAFTYRAYDDQAIMHSGNYQFNNQNAEIIYLGLTIDEKGEFSYKEISKEEYENYHPNYTSITENAPQVIKNIANTVKGALFGLANQYEILKNQWNSTQEVQENVANEIQEKNTDDLSRIKQEIEEEMGQYNDVTEGYRLDQIMGASYMDACAMFFSLAQTQQDLNRLKEILYTGKVGDFEFSSGFTNIDNPLIEARRRLSMASLFITNPSTFNYLSEHHINAFHGTKIEALSNILEHGLSNVDELSNKNVEVTTGEVWSRRNGARDFTSFTDELDIASFYAGLNGKNSENGMIICVSEEHMKDAQKTTIHSEVPEIGLIGTLDIENIDCILVPSSQVDVVKQLVGDKDIQVLPIDDGKKKFYIGEEIEISYNKYNQLKAELDEKKSSEYYNLKDTEWGKNMSRTDIGKSLVDKWDNQPIQLPRDFALELEKIMNDETKHLGVHLTTLDSDTVFDSAMMKSILTEGLINNGAGGMQGAVLNKVPNVGSTVAYIDSPLYLSMYLKGKYVSPGSYLESNCGVVLSIPSDLTNKEGDLIKGKESEIYNQDRYGVYHIKPEFILGCFVHEDGICKFYSKEEVLGIKETIENKTYQNEMAITSEIVKICQEIAKNSICPKCGGDYQEATCKYCGNENESLRALENQLSTLISETEQFSEDALLQLYKIRTLEIPTVSQILENTNFESFLQNKINQISERANQDALTQQDYDNLFDFIENPIFSKETTTNLINILMKQLLLKNLNCNITQQVSLFKKFIEMLIPELNGFEIQLKDLKEHVLGSTISFHTLQLDSNYVVSCLKNKQYIPLLNTIFHECQHIIQDYLLTVDKKTATPILLLEAKEEVISMLNSSYYTDNYYKFYQEIEARYSGAHFTLQYLTMLGLQTTDNQELVDIANKELSLIHDETRIYQGQESTVSEIFDSLDKDSSLLTTYPILKLQYKEENGKIVPKTRKELEEDYENCKNGNSPFHIPEEMVEGLYTHLFKEVEKYENSGVLETPTIEENNQEIENSVQKYIEQLKEKNKEYTSPVFDSLISKLETYKTIENIKQHIDEFDDFELGRVINIDESILNYPAVIERLTKGLTNSEIYDKYEFSYGNSKMVQQAFLNLTEEEVSKLYRYQLRDTLCEISSENQIKFIEKNAKWIQENIEIFFDSKVAFNLFFEIFNRFGNIDILSKCDMKQLSDEIQFELLDKYKDEIYQGPQKRFIDLAKKINDANYQQDFIKNSPFYEELINSQYFEDLFKGLKSKQFVLELLENSDAYKKVINNPSAVKSLMSHLSTEEQRTFLPVIKEQMIKAMTTNDRVEKVWASDNIKDLVSGLDKSFQSILLNDNDFVNVLNEKVMIRLNKKFDGIYKEQIEELLKKPFNSETAKLVFDKEIYKTVNQDTINRAVKALAAEDVDLLLDSKNQEALEVFVDQAIVNHWKSFYNVAYRLSKIYETVNETYQQKIRDSISLNILLRGLDSYSSSTLLSNILTERIQENPTILDEMTIKDVQRLSYLPVENYKEIFPLLSDVNKLFSFNKKTVEELNLQDTYIDLFRNHPTAINYMNIFNKTAIEFLELLKDDADIDLFYQTLTARNILALGKDIPDLIRLKENIIQKIPNYETQYIGEYSYLGNILTRYTTEEQLKILNALQDKQKYFMLLDGDIESKEVQLEIINQLMVDVDFRSKIDAEDIQFFEKFFDTISTDTSNYILENADYNFMGFLMTIVKRGDINIKFGQMIKENPLILSNYSYEDANRIYDHLSTENKTYIDNQISEMLTKIPSEVAHQLLENATTAQKSVFLKAYQDGLLNDEKISFLKSLQEKNRYVLATFNYKLFDEELYKLSPELLTKLSKYYDTVDQIYQLKVDPKKSHLFANVVQQDSSESNLVKDQKMALILETLLNHDISETLLDAKTTDEINLVRNIILKEVGLFSQIKTMTQERSLVSVDYYELGTYQERLIAECDQLMEEATTIEDAKNIILNRYFSMSIEDANEFIRMYGNQFDSVKEWDSLGIATAFIDNLKSILKVDSLENLKSIYKDGLSTYNMDDLFNIQNEVKKIYTASIKENLFIPENITGYADYKGQKIPLYEPQGEFKMLVQSTYTNYGGMPIINDSYFDSWNLSSRTENHGICCSMISNDNLGMAMVSDVGIVIGFNSFTLEQINMMSPYDIFTMNDGYLINCARPLTYYSGAEIMDYTRHTHNEFNLERTNLTGEGTLANIQPDYVVIFEEMDEKLKENAYKASLEFGIPVVYINKEALAKQSCEKIDTLIQEMENSSRSQRIDALKNILTLHENNRSGLRISNPDLVKQYFDTDKINNVFEKAIGEARSILELEQIEAILKSEKQKFDATLEATSRINEIDIDINRLFAQIEERKTSLQN